MGLATHALDVHVLLLFGPWPVGGDGLLPLLLLLQRCVAANKQEKGVNFKRQHLDTIINYSPNFSLLPSFPLHPSSVALSHHYVERSLPASGSWLIG